MRQYGSTDDFEGNISYTKQNKQKRITAFPWGRCKCGWIGSFSKGFQVYSFPNIIYQNRYWYSFWLCFFLLLSLSLVSVNPKMNLIRNSIGWLLKVFLWIPFLDEINLFHLFLSNIPHINCLVIFPWLRYFSGNIKYMNSIRSAGSGK